MKNSFCAFPRGDCELIAVNFVQGTMKVEKLCLLILERVSRAWPGLGQASACCSRRQTRCSSTWVLFDQPRRSKTPSAAVKPHFTESYLRKTPRHIFLLIRFVTFCILTRKFITRFENFLNKRFLDRVRLFFILSILKITMFMVFLIAEKRLSRLYPVTLSR